MYDLAVIVPARRDSSRIANKVMLPFGDSPSLIEWKLRQLRSVIDPQRIYLSSEDDEFLSIAADLGVSQHKRDPRLATGHIVPMSEVITGIVKEIPHAHIAWCTVVCPLMPPQEYLDAFHRYHEKVILGPFDSLLGVNAMREYFWYEGRSLNYQANSNHISSQNLKEVYKVTNSIYIASKENIIKWNYIIGSDPWLTNLSKLSGVDIDHMEDYQIAKSLYNIYLENNPSEIDCKLNICCPP